MTGLFCLWFKQVYSVSFHDKVKQTIQKIIGKRNTTSKAYKRVLVNKCTIAGGWCFIHHCSKIKQENEEVKCDLTPQRVQNINGANNVNIQFIETKQLLIRVCIQVVSGSGRDRGVGIDREERKIE